MKNTPDKAAAIEEIIKAGRRLAAGGHICAQAGNISCRWDSRTILITAAGLAKANLTAQDVLSIDYQGQPAPAQEGRQPSSETALHLALYQKYPHITAIVHAHPPYATALACANKELKWQMLEEASLFLGKTPTLPRLPAQSAQLAAAAATAAHGVNALLLTGHGALTWGDSIEQALRRMEILEHTARVMLLSALYQQALN